MQSQKSPPNRDIWFLYSRRPGKISASPANARGWLVLAICLAVIVSIGVVAANWMRSLHPILGVVAPLIVIVAGVLLTLKIAVAKGRQVD